MLPKFIFAFMQVSSMLTQCSSPVGDGDDKVKKDPFVVPIETASTTQEPPSGPVVDSSEQPSVKSPPEPVAEDQNGPPEESPINLPDELKGAVFLWLHTFYIKHLSFDELHTRITSPGMIDSVVAF